MPKSKQVNAVETTMVGRATFAEALKTGNGELQECRKDGRIWEVNIPAMRKLGVHGLDLPALPATALSDWGIKRIKAPASATTPASPQSRTSKLPGWAVGSWSYSGNWNGVRVAYSLKLDEAGNFTESISVEGPDVKRQTSNSGTCQMDGKTLVLSYTQGERKDQKITRVFEYSQGSFWLTVSEFGYQLELTRRKE
jgi:hypothetical protein